MNTILKSRLKSLAWRIGMMALAILVTFALENLEMLSVGTEVKVILGLILGEISKFLNVDIKNL